MSINKIGWIFIILWSVVSSNVISTTITTATTFTTTAISTIATTSITALNGTILINATNITNATDLTNVSVPIETHKVCVFAVDCDLSCLHKYKTQENAKSKIRRSLQFALHQFEVNLDTKFALEDVYFPNMMLNYYNDVNQKNDKELLNQYRAYVKLQNRSNCFNMLLVGSTDDDKLLGKAFIGHACGEYGVTYVKLDNSPISIVQTMAHEIGHVMGLNHVCQYGTANILNNCVAMQGKDCHNVKNKYMMYPQTNTDMYNSYLLSPCSLQKLKNNLGQFKCIDRPVNETYHDILETYSVLDHKDEFNFKRKSYIITSALILFSVVIVVIVMIFVNFDTEFPKKRR